MPITAPIATPNQTWDRNGEVEKFKESQRLHVSPSGPPEPPTDVAESHSQSADELRQILDKAVGRYEEALSVLCSLEKDAEAAKMLPAMTALVWGKLLDEIQFQAEKIETYKKEKDEAEARWADAYAGEQLALETAARDKKREKILLQLKTSDANLNQLLQALRTDIPNKITLEQSKRNSLLQELAQLR